MEKTLLVYVLVAAMLLTVLPAIGFEELKPSTEQIPTRGIVLYVGRDQEYSTISEALNASSDGDTIRVFAGSYKENITVKKTVALIGNGTEDTKIFGDLPVYGQELTNIQVQRPNVEICGFSFEDYGIRTTHVIKPVFFLNESSMIMRDCKIDGGYFNIERSIIKNSVIECTFSSTDITIEGNLTEIIGSMFNDCYLRLYGDDSILSYCEFQNSSIMVGGNRIMVENNIIANSTRNAALDIEGEQNRITGNTIKNSIQHGIYLHYSAWTSITFNDLIENGMYGIFSQIYQYRENYIHYNNFIRNGGNENGISQAKDEWTSNSTTDRWNLSTPNLWNSSIAGNYWSDMEIMDMDQDFINDIPYRIDGAGNCSDMKPLVKRIVYPFPPIITSKTVQTVMPGSHLSAKCTALDLDTDQNELEWDLKTNASWLNLNEDNYLYGEVPESTGSFWVSISVTDGKYMDYSNFTLSIDPSSMHPKITTANVLTCYEDSPYQVDYDAEGPDIEWSLTTDAEFLDMNASSGYLTGNPDNSDVGKHSITIKAANKWSTASTTFELEVINVNDPPKVISIDLTDGELKEGSFQEYTGYADDIDISDDGKLVFIWSLDDIGKVGNGTTVRLELEPGVHNLTLTVKDPHGASAIMSISIDIDEMPDTSKDELIRFITSFGLTVMMAVVIILVIASLMFIQIRNRRRMAKGRDETKGNDLEAHTPSQNELDGPFGPGLRPPSIMERPEIEGAESLRTGHLESMGRSGLGTTYLDRETSHSPSPSYEETLDVLIQEVLERSRDEVQTIDMVKVERRLKIALNDGIISKKEYLEIKQDLNDGPWRDGTVEK